MFSRARSIRVVIALTVILLSAHIAEAALPRLLMVFGKPLGRPVVIHDVQELMEVFTPTRDAAERNRLDARPSLDIALFWGNDWNRFMDEGKSVATLKPEDVTPFGDIPVRGRFYPACASAPAQITLTAVRGDAIHTAWVVSEQSLRILEREGIPIRVDCK